MFANETHCPTLSSVIGAHSRNGQWSDNFSLAHSQPKLSRLSTAFRRQSREMATAKTTEPRRRHEMACRTRRKSCYWWFCRNTSHSAGGKDWKNAMGLFVNEFARCFSQDFNAASPVKTYALFSALPLATFAVSFSPFVRFPRPKSVACYTKTIRILSFPPNARDPESPSKYSQRDC